MDTLYPSLRPYGNLRPIHWLGENEFVGTIEWGMNRAPSEREEIACYGWSKGAGFFIYQMSEGHIQKLGSIKRAELFDKAGTPVVD